MAEREEQKSRLFTDCKR